jgi:hypothetical protein
MTRSYHFIFVPASDESVDDEYVMKTPDYENTDFSIQCCPYAGGYSVNQHHFEDGKLTAMTDHGTFKSLKAAQTKAIVLHEKAAAQR